MNLVEYPIAQSFGMPQAGKATVAGFEPGHAFEDRVPAIDQDYLFRLDPLADLVGWWGMIINGMHTDGLFLYGDPAAGKTSLITQMCARLNIPLISITGDEDRDIAELISSREIVDGDTQVQDGLITLAMRMGAVLLINEVSYFRPQTIVSLNDLIETRQVTIPETGEVVVAAPSFGVVVTDNTNGSADESGRFVGTKGQNEAFLDRFVFVQIDPMSPAEETALLAARFPDQDATLLEKMVEVACQVRSACKEGALTQAMSLRALTRWARWLSLKAVRAGDQAIYAAADRAFAWRLSPGQREAFYAFVNTVFGVRRKSTGD